MCMFNENSPVGNPSSVVVYQLPFLSSISYLESINNVDSGIYGYIPVE